MLFFGRSISNANKSFFGTQRLFTGQLPTEIGMLTEMRYFEVQTDRLSGPLPQTLGNWKMLDALLLNYNGGLEGSLDVLQNNELLGTIFVNDNKFNGTLDFLPSLSSLQWFEATGNYFGGTLPEEITALKYLRKTPCLLVACWYSIISILTIIFQEYSNSTTIV